MKTIATLLLAVLTLWFAPRVNAQNLTPLKAGDPVSIELKVPAEDTAYKLTVDNSRDPAVYPVSTRVNSPKNEDPELLERVDDAPQSLF